MATLNYLKQTLTKGPNISGRRPLLEEQYSQGFDVLVQGSNMSYHDFIIPQLTQLMGSLGDSQSSISVLEVGPGPTSIFGYLPDYLRRRIGRYTAFEPNSLFVNKLTDSLCCPSSTGSVLPSLEQQAVIHPCRFDCIDVINAEDTYDIILFCHSMYGMNPKQKFIQHALRMAKKGPQKGLVIVFHRSGSLHFEDLVSHKMATFNTGVVHVLDDDEILDCFASFIAGFTVDNTEIRDPTPARWRQICRTLACRKGAYPDHLVFSAPEEMVVFTQDATSLPELTAQVPLAASGTTIKNWTARSHQSIPIVRPKDVTQVQQCVRWALKHGFSLTVVGGGHSGHCLWPYTVAIDMGAFDHIHILETGEDRDTNSHAKSFVFVEAGCRTGDIIRETMAAGVTVPLGARPSVGAGLWLQGGIGHLSRLYGLACDAIVGVVMVSVQSGQIVYAGFVSSQHRPANAVLLGCERDLMWAMKGAGTNFGIVIGVTLRTYPVSTYLVRNWISPLKDNNETRFRLNEFDNLVAKKLHQNSSADVYLYRDDGRLHFGMSVIEASTAQLAFSSPTPVPELSVWGAENDMEVVDGVGLFETEMYMSKLHGGHGRGKTSSFKRCVFLKDIGRATMSHLLATAIESCPTPLCYLHLLHGGGVISDFAADATAFGSRHWDFACVVTGVWYREQDRTQIAQSAVQWVYDVVSSLLPLSSGAYSADLGPDPRDAALAAKAFGQNGPRLSQLKRRLDPHNVLAYTCPLPPAPTKPRLIILVTGESCAGKDFCAGVWLSAIRCIHASLTARVVSISDATKRKYAMATGADLNLLLNDRTYKEQHRSELTAFFQRQVQRCPRLPEEHFLDVVHCEADADVLIITGMRDKAPVVSLSHLVPDRRLLEVHVQASEQTRQVRRWCQSNSSSKGHGDGQRESNLPNLDYHPSLIFDNDATGEEAAKSFAQHRLLPFLHQDLQRLASMVRSEPNFPRQGTNFRHVLGIPQQPSGLALCTSLLRTHFAGDWNRIDRIVCCEAGGFIYGSPLASQVGIPLVLIRKAGKLPPPTVSVIKTPSYISSLGKESRKEKRIEIERDAISKGASVVVVDDVLSTGKTLCAVLQLLGEVGVPADSVSVLVVAELPIHRGRQLLHQYGFGRVNVRSLLVFDGT